MEAFISKPHVNYSRGKNVRLGIEERDLGCFAGAGRAFKTRPSFSAVNTMPVLWTRSDFHEGEARVHEDQQKAPTSAGQRKVKTT